jgi:putative transposase
MVRLDRKGADWKVKIARRLRRETTASNPWIAQRLHMGHPSRVSNLINEKTFKFYV